MVSRLQAGDFAGAGTPLPSRQEEAAAAGGEEPLFPGRRDPAQGGEEEASRLRGSTPGLSGAPGRGGLCGSRNDSVPGRMEWHVDGVNRARSVHEAGGHGAVDVSDESVESRVCGMSRRRRLRPLGGNFTMRPTSRTVGRCGGVGTFVARRFHPGLGVLRSRVYPRGFHHNGGTAVFSANQEEAMLGGECKASGVSAHEAVPEHGAEGCGHKWPLSYLFFVFVFVSTLSPLWSSCSLPSSIAGCGTGVPLPGTCWGGNSGESLYRVRLLSVSVSRCRARCGHGDSQE